MKKIICISGKQYSGKDTLAKIIIEYLPEFKRIGIGDAIKIAYGKKHNLTYDEIDKNKGIYRTGLIELGDWGRKQDPDYWLKEIIKQKESIIVPDVRLSHEAEIFKNEGALLIRIEADFNTRSKRGIITNGDDLTETALDSYKGFDYVIENNNDYETLKKGAKPLIDFIKENFSL